MRNLIWARWLVNRYILWQQAYSFGKVRAYVQ